MRMMRLHLINPFCNKLIKILKDGEIDEQKYPSTSSNKDKRMLIEKYNLNLPSNDKPKKELIEMEGSLLDNSNNLFFINFRSIY